MMWCDAIIIIYSISDRSSFAEAQRLKIMAKMKRRQLRIVEVGPTAKQFTGCYFALPVYKIKMNYRTYIFKM